MDLLNYGVYQMILIFLSSIIRRKYFHHLLLLQMLFLAQCIHAANFEVYGFIPWRQQTISGKLHKIDVNANLKQFGIKPIRVLYHRSFLTSDEIPDPDKIKQIALSTITDKTPISFDIELGNRFSPSTNLPVILETLRLYHHFGGQAPVGVYAVLPQNVYSGK